ncbi:branched-chain alpha-ketoacid dehydrogenase [Entophlyctis helioformis]|nr:branched-chain alpha-ketoacid dehydrogenase [Entophlyctis helioformis]
MPESSGESAGKHPPSSPVWLASPKIEEYAEKPLNLVTLEYLMTLGRERDIRGCAAVVRHELPIRLARRVRAIQRLPFIVGVNPWIRSVYELYRDSFERLTALPEPQTDADLKALADTLAELTESHQTVVPWLAKGFMECGKYMDKIQAREFLDGMIHARIGIRVIAEHYLSLQTAREAWIGVVNTQVSPSSIIRSTCSYVQELCEYNYGASPDYDIIGHTDTRIAYISVHMEYIFMELLKNAMRATVEYSGRIGRLEHPAVEIAIASAAGGVVVRIRDQGGGIPRHDLDRVWEYSYTTVEKYDDKDEGIFSTQARMNMQQGVGGPIAGLGFGLPMSRIYARYFGGSLEFRSLIGHGTDVFVRFPSISQQVESIVKI